MTKNKQPFKTVLEVQEDENGEAFIQFPEEAMERLGWNECTPISISVEGETIVIKEKTVWELEEFKENLEAILDDIFVNKTKHMVNNGKHLFKIS